MNFVDSQAGQTTIRLVVMKNIFPSGVTLHLKFDLKGSTYGRKVPNSLFKKKNFKILARRLKRRGQKRLQRSKISTS